MGTRTSRGGKSGGSKGGGGGGSPGSPSPVFDVGTKVRIDPSVGGGSGVIVGMSPSGLYAQVDVKGKVKSYSLSDIKVGGAPKVSDASLVSRMAKASARGDMIEWRRLNGIRASRING